ncbi:MAG: hypothetical protein WC279_14030 [Sulfurimonas sp.]|jgi:hypothetical protein|uniref:hypothetical protein n=1 Tax=Sulfurimonas sp. TaxID=2022749 RepID=UPI00356A601B
MKKRKYIRWGRNGISLMLEAVRKSLSCPEENVHNRELIRAYLTEVKELVSKKLIKCSYNGRAYQGKPVWFMLTSRGRDCVMFCIDRGAYLSSPGVLALPDKVTEDIKSWCRGNLS